MSPPDLLPPNVFPSSLSAMQALLIFYPRRLQLLLCLRACWQLERQFRVFSLRRCTGPSRSPAWLLQHQGRGWPLDMQEQLCDPVHALTEPHAAQDAPDSGIPLAAKAICWLGCCLGHLAFWNLQCVVMRASMRPSSCSCVPEAFEGCYVASQDDLARPRHGSSRIGALR